MIWLVKLSVIILGPELLVLLLHRHSIRWRQMHITGMVLLCAVMVDVPVYFGVYVAYAQQVGGNGSAAVSVDSDSLALLGTYNPGFVADVPYGKMIAATAAKHEIDPALFTAVIRQESVFNPEAVSKSGAVGLGQLMPIIINWCGISDPRNPVENLDCSARFLKSLLDKYPTTTLALAAYNAGEPAVDACNCVPMNGETPIYVSAIAGFYREYRSQALNMDVVVSLLYAGSEPHMTQGYHGVVAGYEGYDFAAGCGTPLFSPVPGEAEVVYNGMDGYNHTDGAGTVWPQATMITVRGAAGEVTLLHGLYNRVEVGDILIGGKTRIGSEAKFGYATGCHQHIHLER